METPRVPLPWSRSCFVCGAENPIGLRGRSFKRGDRIEFDFEPRAEHTGWNHVVHGGIIGTVLDEVMTWAAIVASRRPCFAAELQTRLRLPLEPSTRCRALAWLDSSRGRLQATRAELVDADGTVYATASGRYMSIPPEKMRHSHEDMIVGPGCWPVDGIFDGGGASQRA